MKSDRHSHRTLGVGPVRSGAPRVFILFVFGPVCVFCSPHPGTLFTPFCSFLLFPSLSSRRRTAAPIARRATGPPKTHANYRPQGTLDDIGQTLMVQRSMKNNATRRHDILPTRRALDRRFDIAIVD
jgi:hypothetical protein